MPLIKIVAMLSLSSKGLHIFFFVIFFINPIHSQDSKKDILNTEFSIVQKKLIDNNTYKTWETLQRYGISADGKYIWYSYGSLETESTLVVVSAEGKARKEFRGARNSMFTNDSRFILFTIPNGICIWDLKGNPEIIGGKDLQVPHKGNGQWVAYKKDKELLLRNLHNGTEHRYENASGCWFNEDGSVLILRKNDGLSWISLAHGQKEKYLYHGKAPRSITFDKAGKQIVFITGEKGEHVLRYYHEGLDTAAILVDHHLRGINESLTIRNMISGFSPDGKRVFFYLENKSEMKTNTKREMNGNVITEGIDIWSYRDKYLQSQQLEAPSVANKERFMAVVATDHGTVMLLEDSTTEVLSYGEPNSRYVLARTITNAPEAYWDSTQQEKYYLISLQYNKPKQLLPVEGEVIDPALSPTERFMTWCDKSACYSYDIINDRIVNLTAQIPYRLSRDGLHRETLPFYIGGWLTSDKTLLLYDRYDIWQVDPLGKKKPVNITGSYGRDNKIVLRIALKSNLVNIEKDSLLLTGLDDLTGDNGFFKVKLSTDGLPSKCEMEPYVYYFPGIFIAEPPPPVKAANAEVYLLQKQSASMAPNLILTRNFRTFTTLSDIAPQKSYNWMTAERVWWKAYDGKECAGILYKPENFDEKKKYPVIFTYYELRRNELHQFRTPKLSTDNLNIPWYVSHGYIVFIPDIWPMEGHPGKSALISLESAADYLVSTYPWVNAEKIGLQGHSFGGYETNYIITHSNRFAAAQSAAGISNLVSFYGQVAFGGASLAPACEKGQINLGVSLWERPDIYLENSPLLQAHQITTPLLIMHNKNDGVVPFSQSLEFFNALRRLKKKVWLLQYDGEGHNLLFDGPNALDFTIRMEQFFDHHLKGNPAPLWMTQGILARDKGIKSGFVYDPAGK